MVRAINKPTVESRLDRVERILARCYICAKGVMALYGWSEATFYRRKRAKTFPRPRTFPGHLWLLSDLEAAEQAGHIQR